MASGIVEQSSQDSQHSPQEPGASRSKLVQRLLSSSANLPAFLTDLLGTMAVVVAGTEAAGFLIERSAAAPQVVEPEASGAPPGPQAEGEPPAPPPKPELVLRPIAHIRPDGSDAQTRAAALKAFQEILAPCVEQNKDGAVEVGSPDEGEPQFCLITLLRSEGQLVAVAAIITRCRDVERARQRLMSMQLVAGYFELWTMRRATELAKTLAQTHQDVLQLTGAVGNAEGFEAAAMNLCNEVANRTGATRVSLGWVKGRGIKVKALSHTEKFDKKQELIVQLQRAMEECFDQDEPVRFDCDGARSENVTRSAEQLSRLQGGNSVYSVPLRGKEDVLGVLTLEFAPPNKMPPAMGDEIMIAAEVLSPTLRDRHENDRWIAVKVGHSIQHAAELAVGPKHMLVKLIILLVIGAGFFVTFFKPMYHVTCPFTIEAVDKQDISAPFEGILKKVYVVPGQRVQAGELLAEMDTRELEADRNQSEKKAASAWAQHWAAIRSRDPEQQAQAAVKQREAEEYDAEAEFKKFKIDRAHLRAEYPGVVLSGDWKDKQGSVVKFGDQLFELAQSEKVWAVLGVPDRDIQEVRRLEGGAVPAQRGQLATSSLPGNKIWFTIVRMDLLGQPKEGENVFKVYAQLDTQPEFLRPDMQGQANIEVEKRPLVWIWTHRLIDFLRLHLWM